MGSLVKGMEVPKDHKVVKVPTRQPTTPISMRKATVSMMNIKRNTLKKLVGLKNTLQNSTLHTPITPLKHTTFMMKLMSMRQQP
jgi:hypothetical protein